MAPPVFKTGLAANTVAGGFDSLPPPPFKIKSRLWIPRTVPGSVGANAPGPSETVLAKALYRYSREATVRKRGRAQKRRHRCGRRYSSLSEPVSEGGAAVGLVDALGVGASVGLGGGG